MIDVGVVLSLADILTHPNKDKYVLSFWTMESKSCNSPLQMVTTGTLFRLRER